MTFTEKHRTLVNQVIKSFGKREKKDPTSALGIHGDGEYYGCTQNKALSEKLAIDVNDARTITGEGINRNYGEMTGFHAEMMIVYAWKKALDIKQDDNMANMIEAFKKAMKETQYKEGIIAANATCCKHCKNMLNKLDINSYGKGGSSTLTGWWNPLTEKVIPNGDKAFKEDIPEGPKGTY